MTKTVHQGGSERILAETEEMKQQQCSGDFRILEMPEPVTSSWRDGDLERRWPKRKAVCAVST